MKHIVVASLFSALHSASAQWTQLPAFPGTARDDAASFSIDCKVFVGTGMQVGWSLTNDWWRFDVVQHDWQQAASLPAAPRQYCTAQSVDGIGYLFGGLDANGPLAELWAYDINTDSWTQRPSLPGAGRYACASFVHEGKLHVVGGIVAGGDALNEVWSFDPTTDQWSQRASLPGVGRHRAAAVSPPDGTYPLLIGGATANYTPLNEVWQYGPSDNWVQRAPLPEARFGLSASPTPDIIAVCGAVDNSTFRGDGHVYDPTADAWQPWPGEGIPDARRGGTIGWSDNCSGWYFTYYGLGLDSTLTRRNDWYESGFAFGVNEHSTGPLTIFPIPATDHIRVDARTAKGRENVTILDAKGRSVLRVSRSDASPIGISELPAGCYTVILRQNEIHRIGRFIKLP